MPWRMRIYVRTPICVPRRQHSWQFTHTVDMDVAVVIFHDNLSNNVHPEL